MAVKILIHRKIKPGKEKELSEAVRALRFKAMYAQGYISGETLRSIEDPSVHLVISTWKGIEDWNNWFNTPERKAFQQKVDAILEEPTKITAYEYESFPVNADETLSSLEFGHTPLSAEEKIPWKCRRLVIGTGTGALPIMDEVKKEAKRRHVHLLMLPTAKAIEELRENPEDTNAILHVTC